MPRRHLTAIAAAAGAMAIVVVTFLASMVLQEPPPTSVGSLEVANTTTATRVQRGLAPDLAATTQGVPTPRTGTAARPDGGPTGTHHVPHEPGRPHDDDD